ncbi:MULTISPECIES: NfeD family protein [Legionella]|nr:MULTISPECIES: nodulation protein NfeD [Legionella]MCP0914770.1 nodulation protein NfeD [Legionella sp. 27cVA30]
MYRSASNKTIFLAMALLWISLTSAAQASRIIELSIQGGIGPATADYLLRGIEKGQNAELILIQIDTPGGLDKSMRQIVQAILMSDTPVVIYVAPNGARAASAGTFLLYASTIAVMAPGTHLGAASPVSLTGDAPENDERGKPQGNMAKKTTNDAIAYIRSLAQLRGRDVSFAEKAVMNAATLTAPEALKSGVINLIAKNKEDLFRQLDGMTVVQNDREIKLNVKNYTIATIQPDWRMRLLLIITDPTLAYLLLLLGIYGIFFELMNPGFVAPGVIGALAMVLALYALQLLPINYAGLVLILLGIMFIIGEAFSPSFGALGLGGTAAFVLGSIFLIDTEQNHYQIAWSAIIAMAAVNIIFFLVVTGMAVRSRRKPVQHGVVALVGATGKTISTVAPEGQALIGGEIWHVSAKQPIAAHKTIKVVAALGLKLQVEEIQGES